MSAADLRRRIIQESTLRLLDIHFQAVPDMPVFWRHIVYGFQTAIVPYTEEEIRAALADLVERKFVSVAHIPGGGEMPDAGYAITTRGRDFYAAKCPWEKVNEFLPGGRQ